MVNVTRTIGPITLSAIRDILFPACGGLTSSKLLTRPDWCEIHGSRQTCRPARKLVELCVISFFTNSVCGRRGKRCGGELSHQPSSPVDDEISR